MKRNIFELLVDRELWKDSIPQSNINIDVVCYQGGFISDFKLIGQKTEKFRIRNGWRYGNMIYWKISEFQYKNVGIDELLEVRFIS